MVLLCLALLVGVGTTAGWGVGRGVDWVRDVWPDPPVQLLADKTAPPEALDPAGVAEACTPEAVSLDLVSDVSTFTTGDAVDFTLNVTNDGRVPCLVDSATSSMQVVVTGPDGEQVWSSADCATGSGKPALLAPGWDWEIDARWSGITSVAGCEGKPAKVAAGTYTATMALADVPGAEGAPVEVTVEAPIKPTPTPSGSPSTDPATAESAAAQTPAAETPAAQTPAAETPAAG